MHFNVVDELSISFLDTMDKMSIVTLMQHSQNKWNTIKALARRRGVNDEAVRKWQERGAVPGKWHLPLLQEAKQSGAELDPADLMSGLTDARGRVWEFHGVADDGIRKSG